LKNLSRTQSRWAGAYLWDGSAHSLWDGRAPIAGRAPKGISRLWWRKPAATPGCGLAEVVNALPRSGRLYVAGARPGLVRRADRIEGRHPYWAWDRRMRSHGEGSTEDGLTPVSRASLWTLRRAASVMASSRRWSMPPGPRSSRPLLPAADRHTLEALVRP
jgi:hypothetical protein